MRIVCQNPRCFAYKHRAELPEDVLCCPYCGITYLYQDLKDSKAEAIRNDNLQIAKDRREELYGRLYGFAIISLFVLLVALEQIGWAYVAGHPEIIALAIVVWLGSIAGWFSFVSRGIRRTHPYRTQ